MVFVPLPLFACLLLVIVAARFVLARDMSVRAHQLFLGLIVLYAVQSFLLTLRWGYGVAGAAGMAAVLAPVLPVIAMMSYGALTAQPGWQARWPLALIPLTWIAIALAPEAADAMIMLTYLGIGALLMRQAMQGPDRLTLPPLGTAREIIVAMALTGAALFASGLTDIYVVVDFIRTGGANIGLVVTFVQTAFAFVIGLAATFGRVSEETGSQDNAPPTQSDPPCTEDAEILARLEALFDADGLHKTEDISLRRLARRLGLPDRRVSNAINRSRGQSVSQFVNDRRVQEACALLLAGDQSILMVSLEAGFATKSNFNREFRRVTGQSPSVWRAENRLGSPS